MTWSEPERAWRDTLLSALAPGHYHPLEPEAWELWLDAASPMMRLGLRASVWTLTWWPLVLPRFGRPLHHLTADARDAYISWLPTRGWLVRQLVLVSKVTATMAAQVPPPMTELVAIRGAEVRVRWADEADVVVVGSGPAGSAAARVLAQAGADVLVVEAGRRIAEMPPDAWTAMARAYRGMGGNLTRGRAPMPYVQGRAVGGGSVINGAISWRLPRDVWDGWVRSDPAVAEALPWEELAQVTDELEERLHIEPTDASIAGRNNDLLAAGAAAVGLEHRPIRRNVVDCEGLGRCMMGCPAGHKVSMDRSLLADAVAAGARVASGITARRVEGRTVRGSSTAGAPVRLRARRAVVVAASAVGTPLLLQDSGVEHPELGRNFRAHPGAGVLARFAEPVGCWEGATQGREVIGLREEGLKFEALGLDRGVLGSRLPGLGRELAIELDRMDRYASWAVAVKAKVRGTVRRDVLRAEAVRYGLGQAEVRQLRRGLATMGRMALGAGAEEVVLGVAGWPQRTSDPRELDELERAGPTDPRAYSCVITHMFGTCRMSSRARSGVVDLGGHVRGTDGVWVVDSSVFPTNTGVNPQTSILAIATLLSRAMLGRI